MMKKHVTGWILAVLALLAVNLRAQSDEALFNATVKQVDSGGIYLNYVNQRGIAETVDQILKTVLQAQAGLLQQQAGDRQAQLITSVADLVLRLIRLEDYKAQATSCVAEKAQAGAPMYFYKNFLYTGSDPQGILFDFYSRQDRPFTMLGNIPYNTRLAAGGHITPEAVWQKIALELSRESNPQLKELPPFLTAAFEQQTQVKLADLLKSIEGEYSLLVTSSGTATEPVFRFIATISDKDGVLANLLKGRLPPNFQRVDDKVILFPNDLNFPKWVAPQVITGDGKVILVSHPAVLEEIKTAETTGMFKASADFVKDFPQEGLGYFYLDINQNIVDMIIAATGNSNSNNNIKEITSMITLPRVYAVTSKLDGGYLSRVRSNYSLVKLQTLPMVIWMGTILPSLNAARSKAQNVSCINNLKQIGLAAILYANDNNEKLPEGTSDEIFKIFCDEGGFAYLQNIIRCPGNPAAKTGYFFIGGFKLNELRHPSQTPLAFDKPGNHKNVLHVLFADGHVEAIPIKDYKQPEDAINAIIDRNPLPPEEKADLLERCKKL